MLILQEVVFENNLERGAGLRDDGVDLLNLGGDIVPVPAEGFANVDDHVDFLAAGFGCGLGFEYLDLGCAVAMGESDDGADKNVCAL